jgi:hypothetical protein
MAGVGLQYHLLLKKGVSVKVCVPPAETSTWQGAGSHMQVQLAPDHQLLL